MDRNHSPFLAYLGFRLRLFLRFLFFLFFHLQLPIFPFSYLALSFHLTVGVGF